MSIGLSDQAPKKDGIWVKYRLAATDPWSEAKCLLAPGRNDSREKMGVQYLCTISETWYLHSRRIYLSWWHGFEKTDLEQSGSEAVIDVFARSNIPFMSRLRNMCAAFRGRPTDRLEDEYKVYLQYQEDAAGVCTYLFEIVDHEAALYDTVIRTKGIDAARDMPKGNRIEGIVIPGQRSYQGLLGFKKRKMEGWAQSMSTMQDKPSSSSTPWYRKIPFLRKKT